MENREIHRLTMITGINSVTILAVAGLAVLLSLVFSFSWTEVLAGLAVSGSACLELAGCLQLRQGRWSGLTWARRSQAGVLISIFTYCAYQLLSMTPDNALLQISSTSREILMQLYSVDETILGYMLQFVARVTYTAVMLASFAYQGGLYWYYGRKESQLPSLRQAAAAAIPKSPNRPELWRAEPYLLTGPTIIQAAGNKPKRIEEFIGRVNSGTGSLSIARMNSPEGWIEPGQTPQFDEYTLVLRGTLRVRHRAGHIDVQPGQTVICPRGTWVQYSTPLEGGSEYIAVCVPAFSPESVHRDE